MALSKFSCSPKYKLHAYPKHAMSSHSLMTFAPALDIEIHPPSH